MPRALPMDRRTRLSVATVLLLFLTVGAITILWSQMGAYRANINSRAALQGVVEKDGDLIERSFVLQEEVGAIRRKIHGDTTTLPTRQVEAHIIGKLQHVSWDNAIELISIEPGEGDDIQMFREILFDVTVTGSYFDLVSWLRDAREALGFVVIQEYEMRPLEPVTDSDPNLSLSLTMVAYRQLDGA